MRTYEVMISDDAVSVTIINDGNKTSTIIVPTSDRKTLEHTIADLLQNAYLDGKMAGREEKEV